MSGETDLATMLATLDVEVREGTYVYATTQTRDAALDALAVARIDETSVVTYVLPVHVARTHGIAFAFETAWLTLTVHSALHAVGLTAAVAQALASRGIACNVLAGFHHDHLLVPADRVDDAITALHALRTR